ncbi:MAG TPA: M23 family metallopeptidase [Solirubrobacterales bacterium]
MRFSNRVGAALAGFAFVATPVAFAAAPTLDEGSIAAGKPLGKAGKDDVVLSDLRAVDIRQDAAQRKRRERLDGPFHPVVIGAVDYGEAGAGFGAARSGHTHEGQDVFAPSGTPLVAVADGEVVEAGTDGGRGNYVSVYDPAEDKTYNYFHMVEPASVAQGERVEAGQELGGVGCTGSCWGDHLHFEVHAGRDPYGPAEDPLPLLQSLPQAKG